MLDTAHKWAEGTISKYSGQINRLHRFEQRYALEVLPVTVLKHSPRTPVIPLVWALLEYTVPQNKGGGTISHNTSRATRSAAGHR